jgi:hypothetical protein
VWERGAGQHPADRALTLLTACSGKPWEELAPLSLGQRDGLLLEGYAQLFGDALHAFAECPQCGERLEYGLSVRELTSRADVAPSTEEMSLAVGEISLRLHPLNSLDLGAASVCADVAAARRLLAERCVVQASRGGNDVAIESLPESVVERISERLAEADPQAEMLVDLTCAGCHHQWQIVFEIERFFWMNIRAVARRLLREVHTLALAYGWSEHDILALSPLRRQFYLEAVG